MSEPSALSPISSSTVTSPTLPASFWQRLAAGMIDFIVTGLVFYAIGEPCSMSKSIAEILILPMALIGFLYSATGHALFGKTIGKYVLKIKVVRLDGSAIGWNESLRRSSVEGILEFTWALGLLAALSQLPVVSFAGQGWSDLYQQAKPLIPENVSSALLVGGVWDWSELVTMLLNRRRRALHDFIGSTMVVRDAKS